MLCIAGCRESGANLWTLFTQDDLAALAKPSRTTVSLVVRSLATLGFISPGYGVITINSPALLRRFAG
jgi:hypothetical protein